MRDIPAGRTRAYGEVALLAGAPGGARAVVQALGRLRDLPWWRVIRSDGTIAPQMMPEQAERLTAEGVAGWTGRRVVGAGRGRPPRVILRLAAAPSDVFSPLRRAFSPVLQQGP